MPQQDYVATTDIKHGRLSDAGSEIITYEEGEVVDPAHFTDEQFDHLVEIGTLVPQAVSKQAGKLEEEVAKLQAQLAEANRALAAAQADTATSDQGPDPAHSGAAHMGPAGAPANADVKVATAADLQKATETGTPAHKLVSDKETADKDADKAATDKSAPAKSTSTTTAKK